MTKLEAVSAAGQRGQRRGETRVVPLEGRRQLPEHRAELWRAGKRLQRLVEAGNSGLEAREAPDVGDVAAHLHGEEELWRRCLHPAAHGRLPREPVEGVVDLDGVEERRVVLEPAPRREALRGDALTPVRVVPPRAPDADLAHLALLGRRWWCEAGGHSASARARRASCRPAASGGSGAGLRPTRAATGQECEVTW